MKEFIGKKCKITFLVGGKTLHYTAKTVTSVSDSHISFIDKFEESHCFRIQDIIEINGGKGI